jgi:hypothetical protein
MLCAHAKSASIRAIVHPMADRTEKSADRRAQALHEQGFPTAWHRLGDEVDAALQNVADSRAILKEMGRPTVPGPRQPVR